MREEGEQDTGGAGLCLHLTHGQQASLPIVPGPH